MAPIIRSLSSYRLPPLTQWAKSLNVTRKYGHPWKPSFLTFGYGRSSKQELFGMTDALEETQEEEMARIMRSLSS